MRALIVALALLLTIPMVHAKDTASTEDGQDVKATRTTDWHAYTLDANEFRLGLFTFEYGIMGVAEIGTAPLLLALNVRNVFTKVRVYQDGPLTLSLSAGYLALNTGDLEVKERDENGDVRSEPQIDLFSANGGVTGSWQSPYGVTSATLLYGRSGIIGDSGGAEDFEGALIGTTGTLRVVYEYRTSDSFAVEFGGHLALFEEADADVSAVTALGSGDPPRATLEVFGAGQADLADTRKANGSASILWTYGTFNLKLGLTYGYVQIPLTGMFLPGTPSTFPILDIYWRF